MAKEFTKFSKNNLRVIQNFLLYIQKENEFRQAAIDYIEEDHVDGENSQQALLERAMASELIGEDVLVGDDEKECNIYADNEFIYCVENATMQVSVYRLKMRQEIIESEFRDEILTYCLGKYYSTDEVSLKDIFVHGKHIEKIS